jgi:CubicO group peptidase (beta-lactamase class C family)
MLHPPFRPGLPLAAITALAANACLTDPPEADESVVITGTEVAALAPFDRTVTQFMTGYGITAAALAVTRNGAVILERGYTYRPTEDDIRTEPGSLFRIASISKPITAVAVLELVERGHLDLSDRVVDLLELDPPAGQKADPRLPDVTVRHLLEHLGGWDRDLAFDPMFADHEIASSLEKELPISQDDIMTYMSGQPLQHDPGTTYAYSNYGYMLLGRVIEGITGSDYETFVADEILGSIGATRMRIGRSLSANRLPDEVAYHAEGTQPSVFEVGAFVRAGYGDFNLENMDSHGGWLASAGDLARFAASFDVPESHPVLDPASIERMFALPENLAGDGYSSGDAYYALGWAVRDFGGGERNTWHDGSLPGTYTLMVRRRDGVGWVILFNKRGQGFGAIDALLHQAADRVDAWPGALSHE